MRKPRDERRDGTRMLLNIPGTATFLSDPGPVMKSIEVRNISAGGAFMNTDYKPQVGSSCNIDIFGGKNIFGRKLGSVLPNKKNTHVIVQGKIIRIDDESNPGGRENGIAIKFSGPVRIVGSHPAD